MAYTQNTIYLNKYFIGRERNAKLPKIINKYARVIYIHNGKETRTMKKFPFYSTFTIGSLHETRRTHGK